MTFHNYVLLDSLIRTEGTFRKDRILVCKLLSRQSFLLVQVLQKMKFLHKWLVPRTVDLRTFELVDIIDSADAVFRVKFM